MFRVEKSKRKGIIGVCILIIATGLFLYWENYGREDYTYVKVVVLNEDAKENTPITKSMLGYLKVPQNNVIADAVKDPSEIIGKTTNIEIPLGLQLSPKFFRNKDMSTGNGTYVLAIPEDWLYSFPQTIRRGDQIYFYPIINTDEKDPYAELAGEGIVKSPEALALEQKALMSTRVAYVKDNTNREVVDVKQERMDGSSSVSQIEVYSTEEEYQKLKDSFESGFRFIIMYE